MDDRVVPLDGVGAVRPEFLARPLQNLPVRLPNAADAGKGQRAARRALPVGRGDDVAAGDGVGVGRGGVDRQLLEIEKQGV